MIGKIVITKKVQEELDGELLNTIIKIIAVKRLELDLAGRISDELQIIDFCKDEEIELNYIIYRQENVPSENIIGFKDELMLNNIPDSLINKTIYAKFEYLLNNELCCTILFAEEY